MLRIGIMGAGHLGKIHIKCIQQIPEYKFVGFFDPDQENAKKVAEEYNTHSFSSIEELIDEVDVVDIVTPTLSHFDCASKSLKRGKHVFIEKPIAASAAEAKKMIELSTEANVKVQVGHVERFNPAFTAAVKFIENPMFIETHRLAQFNPRGTDVPVILDLMIHDIDIVLSVVKSNVRKISASGVKVVSDTPDIANARIEFDNGCVANLTASRISMKNMRKSRFFQKDAYIAVDFLEKTTEIVRMKEVNPNDNDPFAMIIELGENKGSKQIFIEKPEILAVNAIKMELEAFYHSIINNTTPLVSIIDGYNALNVAYQIIDKLND
ncbi:MAG: Gfo/Idh/MocA family oxidoreductase [Bacteroidetes bacterium]|nr:Gfo/Idh/MocA family oxidoreductase [Bacteroidota bacterium]